MTLRTRLLLAQLPLALSLLLVGAISRRTVSSLDESSQAILKDNYLSVVAAQRMRDAADAMGRTALAHTAMSAGEVATFEHELRFQETNITEIGERQATERTRAAWTRFASECEALTSLSAEIATKAYYATTEKQLIEIERATTLIVTLNEDAMQRKSERARRHAERISSALFIATALAFALGLFASLWLTSRLTRPLSVLAQAVRRIGQGDLEARARIPGQDEVAAVARELNTMAQRLERYRSSSLGELLQAQESSQAAIDSLPDPVLVLQLSGDLVAANRAAASFGVDSDAQGDAALAHLPASVRGVVDKLRQHVASGKGAYVPRGLEEALPVSSRDGLIYVLARATPVHGEDERVVGLTILFQDVTRLRRFDELKTDLVATVAHEFRTPLTSLRMAIHLCVEGAAGELTPKQAELLHAAREDCERLQGIVDDILDLSRIQGGQLELHRRAVSSDSLLTQALDDHRASARERGIELVKSGLTIDRRVLVDPERVRLVLSNLVTNALRHTPSGGTIELRAAPDDASVRFEVSDTGGGVPTESLPRLFDRFYRAPGTTGSGAGLGLFICKEIVEAHGGRIGVESDPGQGALFWYTLPTAPSNAS